MPISHRGTVRGKQVEEVTVRALATGLMLIPLNAWWLTHIEYVRYSDNATTSALFFNCVAVLLMLLGANTVLSRLAPRLCFSRGEILTIYVMLVVASALGGHDQLQILFTTITWVFRNATAENRWAEELHPHIPRHLVVFDANAVDKLYLGGSSLYVAEHWRAWIVPLTWWTLFAIAMVWTMLCGVCILRKQWDYERLNYPIAGVPLEATSPRGELFASRLFWIAFFVAAAIQFWRLAHNLWPAVPPINIGVYNYTFKGLPLSAAGSIPLSSYPFSYGMAYLLPVQLALSVWAFFWLARVEMVVAAMFGLYRWRGFPYVQQQGVGAYIGVAIVTMWAARNHLSRVWRSVTGRDTSRNDAEPMPYSVAVWGLAAGFAAMLIFSLAAGMRPFTALCFLLLFFGTVLTLTRIRAELGLPTIELYQVGADDILQNIAGTRAWSKRDLAVMSLYFWMVRTHRQLPMPIHADILRIGREARLSPSGMAAVIMIASALAIPAAFWAYLHVMYQIGYETAKFTGPAGWAFGNDPWRKLQSWLANPRRPQYGADVAYLFGVVFTLFLAAMRTHFVWWPFHPVGYVVAGSFGLFRLWLPIFLTWLLKSLLLRYGGMEAYRKARPFFIGLIFGEFSAAFARTLLDLAFDLHLPAESGVGGL